MKYLKIFLSVFILTTSSLSFAQHNPPNELPPLSKIKKCKVKKNAFPERAGSFPEGGSYGLKSDWYVLKMRDGQVRDRNIPFCKIKGSGIAFYTNDGSYLASDVAWVDRCGNEVDWAVKNPRDRNVSAMDKISLPEEVSIQEEKIEVDLPADEVIDGGIKTERLKTHTRNIQVNRTFEKVQPVQDVYTFNDTIIIREVSAGPPIKGYNRDVQLERLPNTGCFGCNNAMDYEIIWEEVPVNHNRSCNVCRKCGEVSHSNHNHPTNTYCNN